MPPPPPYPGTPPPPYPQAAQWLQPGQRTGARRPPTPPRPTFWERISRVGAGSRVLAWVGGGVTLVGIVLLLVLAVQRGYLGPFPRVLVGAALGVALVGIGLFLHRNPAGRTGARAIAATGVAALYLDVIGATSIYSYLPAAGGLLAGLAVAGGGVAIAARWDSQLFAVFVVAGCAASAPVLTCGFDSLLVGFLLVLQIATAPVQLTKRWTALGLAAAIPPVFATLVNVAVLHAQHGADALTVAFVCTISAAVQVLVASATAVRGADTDFATGLLIAAPLPALLGAALAARIDGALLTGALAVLLLLVWTAHRVGLLQVPESFAATAAAGAALAAFEALCLGFDGNVRAGSLLGVGVLLALAARSLRYPAALAAASVFAGVGALLTVAGPLRPGYLAHAPIADIPLRSVVTAGTGGLLLAVAAIVLAWVAGGLFPADRSAERLRWLGSGLAALYGGSGALLSIGLAVDPGERGFLVGHVLVTVSWTLAALVLLLRHLDSTPLRVAGLSLVGAAVAKLVVFDLASLSGIPRVLAFLGAGLVLLGAGARYARLVAGARTE